MNKLKLLYSYEEYKNNKNSRGLSGNIKSVTERTMRLLELTMKSVPFNNTRTEEEEQEYKELSKECDDNIINEKYTRLTHEITDLFFELKDTHDNEHREHKYLSIGRKQCEIEMMKEKYENE